ncbi:MAG TPA: hypothetical protein VH206_14395 [Xanthobacteraceae bacterium]|jgi:hypothetical protein|nr:hypothetical protein [Xanthobacteraceae bacterium]
MFWLVLKNGRDTVVTIQPADQLVMARMRASIAGIKGEFVEAFRLDAKTARKIPKAMIGTAMSRAQAAKLLKKLG